MWIIPTIGVGPLSSWVANLRARFHNRSSKPSPEVSRRTERVGLLFRTDFSDHSTSRRNLRQSEWAISLIDLLLRGF